MKTKTYTPEARLLEHEQGLPRLLLIADRFHEPSVRHTVLSLAERQMIPWIQLRSHEITVERFVAEASFLVSRIRHFDERAVISLNGHPDLAVSLECGVHVGSRGPSSETARAMVGPDTLLGFSAHTVDDLSEEVLESVDYVTISPIFRSISKPDVVPTGLGTLRAACSRATCPVMALGGVVPIHVEQCFEAGAYGVAVVGGILQPEDPLSAAQAYSDAIDRLVLEHDDHPA